MAYKWNPAEYATSSAAQLEWARALLAKVGFCGHETVLDVGCGDGKITAEVARALPRGRILGIDQSPEMIEFAQATFGSRHYPNLSFQCMDARRIELPGQKFDVVFSNAALHWVDEHPAFLTGASRVMAQGARLLLSFGGRGNAAGMLAVLEPLITTPPWREFFKDFQSPYVFLGPEQYRQWLPQAGFDLERAELIPKDMVHSGAEGLANWLRTTWLPYTSVVPEARREEFIQEAVTRYLQQHPLDGENRCHVRMVRLEIDARHR